MTYPAVTYSFAPNTTILSGEVNQNFDDVIDGITDGTKDLNVNSITVSSLDRWVSLPAVDFHNILLTSGIYDNDNGTYSMSIVGGTTLLGMLPIRLPNGSTTTTFYFKYYAGGISDITIRWDIMKKAISAAYSTAGTSLGFISRVIVGGAAGENYDTVSHSEVIDNSVYQYWIKLTATSGAGLGASFYYEDGYIKYSVTSLAP